MKNANEKETKKKVKTSWKTNVLVKIKTNIWKLESVIYIWDQTMK